LKLCPKIILEGTRLTHKTDIAFALNEHPRLSGACNEIADFLDDSGLMSIRD